MKDSAHISPEELFIQLWSAGYTVPPELFERMINASEAKATVVKRIKRSEALFVDESIDIAATTRAAFVSIYARYTARRGYPPLIRKDWTKYQRELAQLQQLVELKQANLALELENIFRTIFTKYVKEREFRTALRSEIESRLSNLQLQNDVNADTFRKMQQAYIKLANDNGYAEYAKLAQLSLEPFARIVDLADMIGADLTDLFYAQFHVNWGREFPKPSNLYDASAPGRYADYCAKLRNQ